MTQPGQIRLPDGKFYDIVIGKTPERLYRFTNTGSVPFTVDLKAVEPGTSRDIVGTNFSVQFSTGQAGLADPQVALGTYEVVTVS